MMQFGRKCCGGMKVRNAEIADVQSIYNLICQFAEHDKMLFRDPANIYENLQTFKVAVIGGKVVGCCALQVIWTDLAEIKSLAVDKEKMGKGLGSELVKKQQKSAKQLGITKVFTLTLEPGFFEKLGFERVEKKNLPMKVWSDCARCPKQKNCDEIALVKMV